MRKLLIATSALVLLTSFGAIEVQAKTEDKSIKTVTEKDAKSKSSEKEDDEQDKEEVPIVATIGALDSGDTYVFLSEDGKTIASLNISDEVWATFIDKFDGGSRKESEETPSSNSSYPSVSKSTGGVEDYDSVKVTGDDVRKAIKDFKEKDIAIVVQTEALVDLGASWEKKAINYGALLTSDGSEANGSANATQRVSSSETDIVTQKTGDAYYIEWADETSSGKSICRLDGQGFYTGELHTLQGVVSSNYNTKNLNTYGNACYVDSKDTFTSVLIKNNDGEIIGIFFKYLA